MIRRRPFKWLLPMLAVVLNLGGGPVAWAALAGHEPAGRPMIAEMAGAAHEGATHEAASSDPDSCHPSSGQEGCCASGGACYCGCPAAMVLPVSGIRVRHEQPAPPCNAARSLLPPPDGGRLLRPPIS